MATASKAQRTDCATRSSNTAQTAQIATNTTLIHKGRSVSDCTFSDFLSCDRNMLIWLLSVWRIWRSL